MPAKNPRVSVVLEKPLYRSVEKAARRDGVSVSTKLRDMVREAVESSEDAELAKVAEARERYFSWDQALPHEKVFKKTRRKRPS